MKKLRGNLDRSWAVPASLVLIAALTSPALAQPSASQPGEVVEEDDAGPRPPSPKLASVRATMETFIDAVNRGDYAAAAECLDLSQLPAPVRQLRGRNRAIELKRILDKIERIDFEALPKKAEEPYVFADVEEIFLVQDRNGEWRFSADTVASVPMLAERFAEDEVVEGVVEVPATPAMWLRTHVPNALRGGFILAYWQWLALAVLVLTGAILDRLVTAILSFLAGRRLRKRFTAFDPELLHSGLRPLGLLAMAGLWWFGVQWLDLPDRPLGLLYLAIKFLAAIAVVWSSYRLVDVGAAILERRTANTENRFDDLLVPLIRKSAKIFIAAFGIIFVADALDLPIASLLAGLGLGGIAFALAGQDVVKNLFGSVTVLVDRPFHVGDWVVIEGTEGTVEEVGFRSTRIRTFYNSLITLPNANLIKATVDNYGARRYRRWKTMLALTYQTPPDAVDAFCEGVRELIRQHPYTRKDSFHVYFNGFGASSLDVLLYMFFETPDWATELRERHRLGVDILRLGARLGVEFAFPTQTLFLERESGEANGDEVANTALAYSERVAPAVERGRREARHLVHSVLGDSKPPPVGAGTES